MANAKANIHEGFTQRVCSICSKLLVGRASYRRHMLFTHFISLEMCSKPEDNAEQRMGKRYYKTHKSIT